jgi:hypothetical protein
LPISRIWVMKGLLPPYCERVDHTYRKTGPESNKSKARNRKTD